MSYRSRPPLQVDHMHSLKVDNITYRTSPDTLKRAFEKYGEVGDVYIPRDPYSRESRGFAFVRFYDKRDAEDAMEGMDGKVLDGRELRVAMAKYARPPEPREYGRNRAVGRSSYYGRRGRRSRSYGRSYSRSRSRSRSHSRSVSRSRSRSQRRSRSRSSRSYDKDCRRSASRNSRSRSKSRRSSSYSSRD